jgi:hypothetical protein
VRLSLSHPLSHPAHTHALLSHLALGRAAATPPRWAAPLPRHRDRAAPPAAARQLGPNPPGPRCHSARRASATAPPPRAPPPPRPGRATASGPRRCPGSPARPQPARAAPPPRSPRLRHRSSTSRAAATAPNRARCEISVFSISEI